LSKHFNQLLPPEIEDLFQPGSDEEGMEPLAQEAERQLVIDDIDHFHSAGYFPEKMLVVPDPVRADSLFVYEILPFPDMGDLGDPGNRDPQKRSDGVGYEKAGVHFWGNFRAKVESHIRRCNDREIAGRGKKFPGGGEVDREALGSF